MVFALRLAPFWATDTHFDADRFGGTALTALECDDVRAELSRVLLDQTIAGRPERVSHAILIDVSPAFGPDGFAHTRAYSYTHASAERRANRRERNVYQEYASPVLRQIANVQATLGEQTA